MFHKMNSCSMCKVFIPFPKPAFFSLSFVSAPSLVLFMSTFPKILQFTDNKVTPLELSQTVGSPFIGTFVFIPFFHPPRISSVSHITLKMVFQYWFSCYTVCSSTVRPQLVTRDFLLLMIRRLLVFGQLLFSTESLPQCAHLYDGWHCCKNLLYLQGYAYVPRSELASIIVNVYRTHLSHALAVSAHCTGFSAIAWLVKHWCLSLV